MLYHEHATRWPLNTGRINETTRQSPGSFMSLSAGFFPSSPAPATRTSASSPAPGQSAGARAESSPRGRCDNAQFQRHAYSTSQDLQGSLGREGPQAVMQRRSRVLSMPRSHKARAQAPGKPCCGALACTRILAPRASQAFILVCLHGTSRAPHSGPRPPSSHEEAG